MKNRDRLRCNYRNQKPASKWVRNEIPIHNAMPGRVEIHTAAAAHFHPLASLAMALHVVRQGQ